MPQDVISEFYKDVIEPNKYFASEQEFRGILNDAQARTDFFNDVIKPEQIFTDYSEFENTLGLKKKGTEGTPPPQQRVGSVTKLGGVQFGTPSVPSTSKQPSPSGGGVSPLPSAKFRPEDISKRVKETYARTTDVEDAIIPEVQLPKQGQTREMMFTKARDKFSRQFKEAEAALQEFQPIIQQAEMVQSGVEMDEDTKQQIIEQYNEALPQIQELQDIYSKSIDKVEYFDRALAGDRRLRAQDVDSGFRARFVESGLNQLGSLVANSLAGAARIAKNAYPQNMTALLTVAQEKFQQEGDKLKARAEFQSSLMDEKDNFANKDIADIYKQQGLVGAIDYASKKFTESVPITLGIMAASMTGTGGAVLANTALFGGTANQRYAELENRTDMSESDKVANALGYGTAELLFEGVLSTGLASVYKQMIKTMGKEAAEKAIRKTTIDVITNGVKKYMPLSGAAIEGIGEGATQFTQNFIDKVTDPTQKDKDLLEGVADATAIGSVGGTAMSTPASLSRVVGYLNRGESIKKNEELLKNRVAINTELQNAKSEETAQILQEKDAQLQEQQNDLVISDMKDMQESMSEEDKEVVKSLALKRDELIEAQNEVESEEVKKSIQKDIDSITSEIDKLYNLALSKEKTQDGTEPRAEQPATPPLVDEGGVVPTVTAPQVDSGVIEEGVAEAGIPTEETIKPIENEKEPTKTEDGKPLPEGLSGIRTKAEEREASTELRTEEEEVAPQATPTPEGGENPALKDVESTAKALEGIDKKNYKKLTNANSDVSVRGVKFSDIFVGDTLLDDLISNLNEEDKRQVKEIFSRGVEYFEFNDAEQKAWENKFTNPEDFEEVFDMLSTSELGRSAAYQNYNDRNYENVASAINYILNNKNEYSKELVGVVEKIDKKLKNPKNSTQRLYAIDIESSLGFSKSPKQLSEAYHKAKADGSNHELVAAVEELLGQKPSPSVQVEGQPITSPQTEDFTPQQKEGAKPDFDIDISDIPNKKIVSNANRIRLSKEKTYIEKRSNSLKKLIDCIYG